MSFLSDLFRHVRSTIFKLHGLHKVSGVMSRAFGDGCEGTAFEITTHVLIEAVYRQSGVSFLRVRHSGLREHISDS